jgi:sugar phosphate isomerase/epimerase
MELTCTSWSFPALTLKEVAEVVRALGIDALDIGTLYKSALDRRVLLESPETLAEEVRTLGVRVSNLYYLFGATLDERNLANPEDLSDNVADFEQVVRFCRELGIMSVMVLPGMINPGQSRRAALKQSAHSLNELLPIAQDAGVSLTIEPHVHSYLESPQLVLELLASVPGLKLTLDYSHFVCIGYSQEEINPLAAHAAHVHLRQARPGALQAKLLQGTINFPALIATLKENSYDRYLALEFVHQDYMGTLYDDVLTETVQLRDLLRRFI